MLHRVDIRGHRPGLAAGGLPLLAGDPVHEPVTANLGSCPVLLPANAAEDSAHGMVHLIGTRLDELAPACSNSQSVSRLTASLP